MQTIGSLCTGIAGLDLAVEQHFDADLIWMSDDNDKASEFLSVRYPDVPNIGDLRTADPATLEVPTILTMGFPCQPVSAAGLQKGIDDDRWLFDDICVFIDQMTDRPELLVIENVRNLLSHDQGRTALNVVRQVAGLGFDLRWGCVRASDAHLPHKRERFFAVATYADDDRGDIGRTEQGGPGEWPDQGQAGTPEPQTPRGGETPADTTGMGREPRTGQLALAGRRETPERAAGNTESRRGDPTPTYADHTGRGQLCGSQSVAPELGPTECGGSQTEWGDFTEAIRRWELISGHTAPRPVDEKGRLSPLFVEWMCGFEPGYLTNVISTRTAALHLLGNSVCPPQAALALELLTK